MSPLSPGEHVFPEEVERKVPGDRGDPCARGSLVVTPL